MALLLCFPEELDSLNEFIRMIIWFGFVDKFLGGGEINEFVAFGSVVMVEGCQQGLLVGKLLLWFTHIILFILLMINKGGSSLHNDNKSDYKDMEYEWKGRNMNKGVLVHDEKNYIF